jgi:hypothetical protein
VSDLARAQTRLWRLIAGPEGVRVALAEEPPGEAPLAALLVSDKRLDAETRLDVYANAYFYRILDVLREDYPALEQALGETAFHDLVTSYLAIHPSRHPSLRYIGARLAGFLTNSSAAENFRRTAPWAADLAAFEWALGEAFDAADSEAARREDVAGLEPEAWAGLGLAFAPCVRLLDLEWPVDTLRAAARAEEPLPTLERRPTGLCIWRGDERVHHRTLEGAEALALAAVAEGTAFGALCETVAANEGDADAPALCAGWLGRWLDDALLLPFEGR